MKAMKKNLPSILTLFLILTLAAGAAPALEAQKIAEIKANGAETIWQFAARLPASFEAQILYGLVIAGLIGMLSSWAWKWSQGNADGWHHFTKRYVVGQVLWIIGSSVAALMTVGFSTDDGTFFGWYSVLWSGGFAGFSGEIKTGVGDLSAPKPAQG